MTKNEFNNILNTLSKKSLSYLNNHDEEVKALYESEYDSSKDYNKNYEDSIELEKRMENYGKWENYVKTRQLNKNNIKKLHQFTLDNWDRLNAIGKVLWS